MCFGQRFMAILDVQRWSLSTLSSSPPAYTTQFLDSDQIDHYVKQIEKAREEEAERRKAKKTTTSSAPA